MKKQMKWLLAALALAALATPAFAVTADMTGTLGVRAFAVNNLDGNDSVQDHGKFVDQRFRLFTSVAANENVKAVLGLEVDNVWGTTVKTSGATPATAGGTGIGAMGADAKGELEVKHLYLDFKIPALGANVKAGTQPFNFGRGLIINDDAAGLLFTMPCPAMPDNSLQLSWIKTSEMTAPDGDDDGDFYGAKYSLKVAGIGIAPYAGYYTAGDTSDGVNPATSTKAETDAAFFGVDVDGKAGAFGYALTAIYNDWNNAATDGSSVSLYGKGTMGMGDTTLSLEAAHMGDDKNLRGNAMSLKQRTTTGPINNFSEIITGGMYTTNNAGYTVNNGGAEALYDTNFFYVKVGAAQKLSDSTKVSVSLAHIEQAEDTRIAFNGAKTKAITYGQELTGYLDYTIVPGLTLNLMGSYLLADSDFGARAENLATPAIEYRKGGDDAYKLASSLNYKF